MKTIVKVLLSALLMGFLLTSLFPFVSLFSFVNVVYANATNVLFEDDFETGDLSKWFGSYSNTNASVEVSSDEAFSGSKSLKVNQSGVDGEAYAYINVSGYTKVNMTWKMKIVSWKGESDCVFAYTKKYGEISNITTGYSQTFCRNRIRNFSGSLRLYPYSVFSYVLASYTTVDDWNTYTVVYRGGENAYVKFYENGTEKLSKTGDGSDIPYMNYLELGIVDTDWDNCVVYYDDVEITWEYDVGVDDHRAYHPATFYCKIYDGDGVSGYIFSYNQSGSWANDTWTAVSGSPTETWLNVSKTLHENSSEYGNPFGFRFYVNDTNDSWIDTGRHVYFVGERQDSFFEIHFEQGDKDQIATEITSPATIGVVNNITFHGDYSCRIYTDEGGSAGRGRLWGDWDRFGEIIVLDKVPDVKECYARLYFYVDSWEGYINPLVFYTSKTTEYLMWATVDETYVSMRRYYPSDETTQNTSISVKTGRWYCLEQGMKVDDSAGFYKVWLDGELVVSETGLNTSGADSILLGDLPKFGVVHYENLPAGNSATIYIDDYVIAPSYIGVEPCDNGKVMYNNTVRKNAGDKYLKNVINGSATHLEWFSDNLTLRTVIRNTTTPTKGEATWYYNSMNGSVRINFSNGTVVNAEDYYDGTSNLITVPLIFSSSLSVSIYRWVHPINGVSIIANVNNVTDISKINGVS